MTQLNDTLLHTHTRFPLHTCVMLLNLSFISAADGPGDRFIIGESQAGEQVRAHVDTLDTHTCFLYGSHTHTHTITVTVTQTPTHYLYMKIKYFTFVLHLTP